jgi:purine-binding chemotaxis protein CheW
VVFWNLDWGVKLLPEDSRLDERIVEILDTIKHREDQEQVIEVEEQKAQLVVFLLGDRYYAFYGESIKEIVTVSEVTYVPGMPEYLLGVVNVRGDIESVLDLRQVLSSPINPVTKRSRIMIGQVNEIRSGLLVDSVEDVLEIPEDHISKPGSGIGSERTEYVVGESMYKEHELIILDIGKIFEKLLNYSL